MSNITKIEIIIDTGSEGTDGDVYLGIGGREFRLDNSGGDFEAGSNAQTFILGYGGSVLNSADNDPRSPYPLVTENLDKYPKYIRFKPSSGDDVWILAYVKVSIFTGATGNVLEPKTYSGLSGAGIFLRLSAKSTLRFDFGAP